MSIKTGSICSGAGIHLHRWANPVWAIECDKEIAQCYRDNHGENIIVDYVQNIDYRKLAAVECLIATPSCKNASTVSNNKETAQDFEVAQSIATILNYLQPQYFILENVVGYAAFTSFGVIKNKLQKLDYKLQVMQLNLADFGIAQSRKRMYLIASKNELPLFIAPQHKRLGWYEAIADLIPSLPSATLASWQQRLIEKWGEIPPTYALKRIGANCKHLRALLPHEPMHTWRALGRSCGGHSQQMNVVSGDNTYSITPKAALRFFGDKETADKIVLPQRRAIASECVGNGASWEIFDWLRGNL